MALEGLLAPGGLIAMGHAEPLNSLDGRAFATSVPTDASYLLVPLRRPLNCEGHSLRRRRHSPRRRLFRWRLRPRLR